MDTFLNILISLVFLIFGIYFVYNTYKKPAILFSTDLKGYIGGIGCIAIGLMSLFGKMNLVGTLGEIWGAITNK